MYRFYLLRRETKNSLLERSAWMPEDKRVKVGSFITIKEDEQKDFWKVIFISEVKLTESQVEFRRKTNIFDSIK